MTEFELLERLEELTERIEVLEMLLIEDEPTLEEQHQEFVLKVRALRDS